MGKSLSGEVIGVQKNLDQSEPSEELSFCSERNEGHWRSTEQRSSLLCLLFWSEHSGAMRKVYSGLGPEDGIKFKTVPFRLRCTLVNHCPACRVCRIYSHPGTLLLHPRVVDLKHWVSVPLMGKTVS